MNRRLTDREVWRRIHPRAIALLHRDSWQYRAAAILSVTKVTCMERVRIGHDTTSWAVWRWRF